MIIWSEIITSLLAITIGVILGVLLHTIIKEGEWLSLATYVLLLGLLLALVAATTGIIP